MNNLVKKHQDLCKELNRTYAAKNSDYNNSFGDTYAELGIISAITRISDKYNRLVSLAKKPEEERRVKDESIRDTAMDMANYLIMLTMELDREKAMRSKVEKKAVLKKNNRRNSKVKMENIDNENSESN